MFEHEQANATARRRFTRTVDAVSIPRRGDRLEVPDVGELVVERAVIVATFPDRTNTPGQPRVIVTLATEDAAGWQHAVNLGWRTA